MALLRTCLRLVVFIFVAMAVSMVIGVYYYVTTEGELSEEEIEFFKSMIAEARQKNLINGLTADAAGAGTEPGAGSARHSSPRQTASENLIRLIRSPDASPANIDAMLANADVDVNYPDDGNGGPLFQAVNQAETDRTVQIVSVLLKHKDIQPNGDPSSWPPLKLAIRKGHRRMVQLILGHAKTIRFLTISGLDCADLASIPDSVHIVLPADARKQVSGEPRKPSAQRSAVLGLLDQPVADCFVNFPRKKFSNDAEVASAFKEHNSGVKATSQSTPVPPSQLTKPPGSAGRRPAVPTSAAAAIVASPPPLLGGALAVNPTMFSSLRDAMWFYLTANASPRVTLVSSFVIALHALLSFVGMGFAVMARRRAASARTRDEVLRAAAAEVGGAAGERVIRPAEAEAVPVALARE